MMSTILECVPIIKPMIPTMMRLPFLMKKTFLVIVFFANMSLYKTQISISAGHTNPNMEMQSAPTRLIKRLMNGIAAAIAPAMKRIYIEHTTRKKYA